MRSTASYLGVAVLALVVLALPVSSARAEDKGGKDEKIAVKDLPKVVTDAVTAAMPGGTITDAEKETKDGKTVYELDVKKDGKTFEVKVDEAGKVLSSKEEKEGDEAKEKKE